VSLSIPSALVWIATGGALWKIYGTGPLLVGIIIGSLVVGYAAYALASFASESGLDSDLMSIWAGYGLRGSAVSSLIYSTNFAILYALEDGIVANAVEAKFPSIPKELVLIAFGVMIVAMTWYGVERLAPVMTWTLPPLLLLLLWVSITALGHTPEGSFLSFDLDSSLNGVPAVLAVGSSLLAFMVDAPIAGDLGRFLGPEDRHKGALFLGFGLQTICFAGSVLFGGWLTYRLGGQTDPGASLVGLAGVIGLLCVLVSQTRIQLLNAYTGSLSLSNFGARSVNFRPGRPWWTVGVVAIATTLAVADLYASLLDVLRFDAVFVTAWTGTLLAYLVTASPERKRAAASASIGEMGIDHRSIVPLGVALVVAVPLTFGAAGRLGEAIAPLVSIALAATGVVLLSKRYARRTNP
jgi:purine-cytosine permease-like protein